MKPSGPEAEVFCPKCRRYVGTFEKCPYCGTKVPSRLAFRALKWGGLFIAIFGVLLLYVDLHGPRLIIREPPQVEIGDISAAMNFAQVYIEGDATFVKYDNDTRFLGMFLADENGNDIFVRAYDGETRRLLEMEEKRLAEGDPNPKFPALGDIVKVRGNLRVRPEFKMQILQFAEGISIQRPVAEKITIENMVENSTTFKDYERFEIEGKIIEIYDGGWAIFVTVYELETESQTSVLIPQVLKLWDQLDAKAGDNVRVRGAYGTYFGNPQLWLASWDDLEVLN